MFSPPGSTLPSTSSFPHSQSAPNLSSSVPLVTAHWFYRTASAVEVWKPFSVEDSCSIEAAYEQGGADPVAVEGTRWDVHLSSRVKRPVYWTGADLEVRRASWFHRSAAEGRWLPYEEQLAARLEEEFLAAVRNSRWQTKVVLDNGEWVMFHSPQVMLHFPTSSTSLGALDDWGQVQPQTDPALRPRVVHRGLEGLPDIPDGETQEVDHLCFVVHGIGAACDIRFRPIAEVVDGFRDLVSEISEKHFAGAQLASRANRVEFLPVNWHDKLHGEDTGTDGRIQPLTLRSIPKLRNFVNDTLLDVLFYTSPIYCQTILDTVCDQINNIYRLYCSRNPGFTSGVSVIGHSLGSLILFDLLSGQSENDDAEKDEVLDEPLVKPQWDINLGIEEVFNKLEIQEHLKIFTDQGIGMDELETCSEDDLKEAQLPLGPRKKLMKFLASRSDKGKSGFQAFRQSSVLNKVSYSVGPAGTGQPWVRYPKLEVKLTAFFALGSPIGMFMAVRGIESLGSGFTLPTCPMFFNVFHPYDPVAYRIESLVDPSLSSLRPLLIPHHMGRKRMHLELKETMSRVGTDLKQRVMEGLKATMGAVYSVAGYDATTPSEEEDRRREDERSGSPVEEVTAIDVRINQGRRVDYVLQEAPMESFNEYVFALASHLCYWSSEDTCLLVLREIYRTMDVASDDMLEYQQNNATLSRSNTNPTSNSNFPPYLPPSVSSPVLSPSFLPPPVGVTPSPSFSPSGGFTPAPSLTPAPLPPLTPAPPLSLTPAPPPVTPATPLNLTPSLTPAPPPTLFSVDNISNPSLSTSRPSVRNPRPLMGVSPTVGMDPTAPIASDRPLAPPPTMGFQR